MAFQPERAREFFLDAVQIDRAHISGESLGGWVAARFALTHPDRLDRLVLNTTGGSTAHPQVMAKIIELSTRAATNPTWEFIKARLEWLMADPASVTDDLVAARQAIYSAPGFSAKLGANVTIQDITINRPHDTRNAANTCNPRDERSK